MDALTFTLSRRLQGEADFTPVAEDLEATDGTATFEDTLPATGTYEYQAVATNGTHTSELSATLTVQAE